MNIPTDHLLQGQLQRVSAFFIWVVFGIAVTVLIGWQMRSDTLITFGFSNVSMHPITAICFLLTFASGYVSFRKSIGQRWLAIFCSSLTILVGLFVLSGVLFDADGGVNSLLYTGDVQARTEETFPGRISPNTGFCFIVTGLAFIFYNYRPHSKLPLAQLFSLIIFTVSLFSLLVYLYHAQGSYGLLAYIPMAFHTALAFFIASCAILFQRPNIGIMRHLTSTLNGSTAARILIPAAIIIPAGLGLLRLWGYRAGYYNNEFGVALLALVTIILFIAILWVNTLSLNRRDLARQQMDLALRATEEQVQAIFSNAPDAIMMIDSEGTVSRWNPAAERLFGWKKHEIVGKVLDDTFIPTELREGSRKGLQRYMISQEDDVVGKTIELWAVRKDRSQVDIALTISPFQLHDRQYFLGFARDITEKKQIDNRLRNFNQELTAQVEAKTKEVTDLFERVTDGFIALDKDFRYTFVNKKAGEIIHRDPESLIGRKVWDVFPDAVGSATYDSFLNAMRDQQVTSSTDYYEPLDLWQENDIYPSPDGLSIFIRDITEKKRAEKNVTQARELADKLIDSLPGVFYFYDENGNFIRWNKQFEEVTGYGPEEIAKMHPIEFFRPEDRDYMVRRITGVLETGVNDAEAPFLTKSGVEIPYYFKAVVINYMGKRCLLGTGIDIEERKKAEEKLRNSEQKYKLLFESNPLPMWMLSLPDYRPIEVNAATLRQYGYSREEFLKLDIYELLPKENKEEMRAATNRNFRGIHHAGVYEHAKKDGTHFFVDAVTHDIYYEEKPVRLVLAHDISEQVNARESVKQSLESVRELTEYLQKVREEERLHISREIHDELGQLLTVLKMDVSWLNKKIDTGNGPAKQKIGEVLTMIDTTVKTVRRIASELRPTLLDDLGLVAAMEWHLEEFERRSSIGKEISVPDHELHIPDDIKIGLFRIFQESLTNVARHSGGNKVFVNLEEQDKVIILTIRDNGKGYVEQPSKKTLGVLGMKERTAVMGGDYTIVGVNGEGTTVTVKIPINH